LKVRTRYYAFIRERIGKEAETIDLKEGSTVADFLEQLRKIYPDRLTGVFESGTLRSGFSVAVNGETLDRANWRKITLNDGDEVVILPPIAGGHLKTGSLTPLCP